MTLNHFLFNLCAVANKQIVATSINSYAMADENGTGSNAVWAIAFVVVVAIIGGVIYYSGILKSGPNKAKDIDINVTVPSAPAR